MTSVPSDDKLFGVYLNDHLAGATVGVELADRLAGENRDRVGGRALRSLAGEIAEDRAALLDAMAALDIPVRRLKTWLGWVGEKAGRLKLNGRVVSRSPLSLVVGLEAMRLGVEGKAAAWRTLGARAARDPRLDAARFDALLDRAGRQAARLERLRAWAAAEAFGGEADSLDAVRGAGDDPAS